MKGINMEYEPQIIKKDGEKEFAVLRYKDYLKIKQALEGKDQTAIKTSVAHEGQIGCGPIPVQARAVANGHPCRDQIIPHIGILHHRPQVNAPRPGFRQEGVLVAVDHREGRNLSAE